MQVCCSTHNPRNVYNLPKYPIGDGLLYGHECIMRHHHRALMSILKWILKLFFQTPFYYGVPHSLLLWNGLKFCISKSLDCSYPIIVVVVVKAFKIKYIVMVL